MGDYFNQTELFIGKILSVDPTTYTMTIEPSAGRMGLHQVRMLVPNSGNIKGKMRGFNWLPASGDWAVCAFLEGYPDYPICLGVVFNQTNTRPPEAASINGQYQHFDYVVQHQTGSFIRFRNLNQPVQVDDHWIEPTLDLAEVKLSQLLSDGVKVNEITMEETSQGVSTVKVGHHTGASVVIDSVGNIVVTPATGKEIKLGSNTSGESLVLGDSLKTWLDNLIGTKLELITVPTVVGPSGTPLNVPFGTLPNSVLSDKAKTEK